MINKKLEEYSKQGDKTKFTETFNELKEFFTQKINSEKYKFNIYLQGSYGNDTNIQEDSDVDIVIELTNVFYSNKNSLTPEQRQDFDSKYSESNISVHDFKSHILNILKNTKKYSYSEKNKCIKIISGTPLNADIIVCASYRHFYRYPKYYEGITFFDKNGKQIISYPKLHKNNMTEKNKRVANFKATVRIFKNIKIELINDSYIDEENISSYFVESLIYNIDEKYFIISNLKDRVLEIISFALNFIETNEMITPCERYYLFGNYDNQWTKEDAIEYLKNAYILVRGS
ncbi:nucleotidyltransferase [Methanobrevibacter sp.]|uniref:nucleotidyltransferase domain-containing protein n=1 Tax=Methanobrevibacter sp. TaxID=66852 RepID=UPI0025DFA644|nr:nucleotidyltransferase [Methanobrevibacter sp.]MBQ2831381.1 nucleotidyltransferase [Methanobrevibacter sp.]